MNIIFAVILFSVIVLFHEFGHFLLARACRVAVLEFSLGMGPRLLSHVSARSGTRYSLKLLPFGGSCRMLGEDGEEAPEEEAQQEYRLRPGEGPFGSKKIWQRFLIIAAGPVFNFLLAFLFAAVIISFAGYDAPVAAYVSEGYPLEQAGVRAGDRITSIGGRRITVYRDITNYVSFHQREMASGSPLTVTWDDGTRTRSARITPMLSSDGTRYILGLAGGGRYTADHAGTVFIYSLYEVRYWILTTLESLRMIGQGEVSLDDVSGPVGVVQVISETYEETKSDGALLVFLNLLNLAILLSANLGVMNLIPFPALDGGRIALLALEAVRRRKLGEEVEGWINLAGFAALMVLMIVILFNDIRKIL